MWDRFPFSWNSFHCCQDKLLLSFWKINSRKVSNVTNAVCIAYINLYDLAVAAKVVQMTWFYLIFAFIGMSFIRFSTISTFVLHYLPLFILLISSIHILLVCQNCVDLFANVNWLYFRVFHSISSNFIISTTFKLTSNRPKTPIIRKKRLIITSSTYNTDYIYIYVLILYVDIVYDNRRKT